jgi:hypothetical protein
VLASAQGPAAVGERLPDERPGRFHVLHSGTTPFTSESRVSHPCPFPARRRLAAMLVLLCAAAPGVALQPPSPDDSARLLRKVDAIVRNGEQDLPSALVTTVTEREVNAYLAFDGRQHLPAGLTDTRITVLPSLNLSGTATVDLDAVRAQRQSRGLLDPLNYLTGKVPVSVSGRLEAAGGVAHFYLDTAKVAGVPVPKMVVQELVSYYSKSENNPRGVSLDDPYPLPARIRQIDVRPGEALVRQ